MTVDAVVLVGLGLAIFGLDIGAAVLKRIKRRFASGSGAGDLDPLENDLLKWGVAMAVLGFVLGVEGKSVASIGIRPIDPVAFGGWVLAGTVFTMLVGMVAYNLGAFLGIEAPTDFVDEQQDRSIAGRATTAVTAGVTESILFQGYPIERLAAMTGNLPLAGGLSLVAFVAAHYTGDTFSLQETLYIAVPAFCVTVLYLLTGNLLVIATVHSLVNLFSLVAGSLEEKETLADEAAA